MHLERYGSGSDPYLGLHGWGNDRTVFAPLAEHVPAEASFYSSDLPGCGLSPSPGEWSVSSVVDEILQALSSLTTSRATIVGHCGGAIFGMLAARELSQTVSRVVAIDPFAYLPRYFRLFTTKGFGRRAYDATFASSLGRRLTNAALNQGREGNTDLTASFEATNHEVALKYLSLFGSLSGLDEVKGLPVQVDLVFGENTFRAIKSSVALFQKVLPHSRTYTLQNARHMPVREATSQLANIIFRNVESHHSIW